MQNELKPLNLLKLIVEENLALIESYYKNTQLHKYIADNAQSSLDKVFELEQQLQEWKILEPEMELVSILLYKCMRTINIVVFTSIQLVQSNLLM